MLAVGIGPIGPFEAIIILAVVLLIFGASRLTDIGGALGKSIREFRKAAREEDEHPAAQATPTCSNCGTDVSGLKFCSNCGAPTGAAVS